MKEPKRMISRSKLYERGGRIVIHAGCNINWHMTPFYDLRTEPPQWFLAPLPGPNLIKDGKYSYSHPVAA